MIVLKILQEKIIEEPNENNYEFQYLGIKNRVTLRKSIKNNLEYKGYYWKRDE